MGTQRRRMPDTNATIATFHFALIVWNHHVMGSNVGMDIKWQNIRCSTTYAMYANKLYSNHLDAKYAILMYALTALPRKNNKKLIYENEIYHFPNFGLSNISLRRTALRSKQIATRYRALHNHLFYNSWNFSWFVLSGRYWRRPNNIASNDGHVRDWKS